MLLHTAICMKPATLGTKFQKLKHPDYCSLSDSFRILVIQSITTHSIRSKCFNIRYHNLYIQFEFLNSLYNNNLLQLSGYILNTVLKWIKLATCFEESLNVPIYKRMHNTECFPFFLEGIPGYIKIESNDNIQFSSALLGV